MEKTNTQQLSKCFLSLHFPVWHRLQRAVARSQATGAHAPRALWGYIFFLLLLFGCFFFFFNLKSLYWPQISFHAYFFFSLSLRCWLQGTRNKGHLMSWGRRWWRCCHGCWTDRAQEINSVNRVWAKTIKSVVLVSPYGAECCHAQAAGQLASCAGLRSPLLHKPVCFSHFQRQALRQTEKLFSSLQLQ